jgi:hypothetical protein
MFIKITEQKQYFYWQCFLAKMSVKLLATEQAYLPWLPVVL